MIEIKEATKYSARLLEAISTLLPQLEENVHKPTEASIRRILSSTSSRLLVATDGERIVGMMTVVIFPIPSEIRAWFEDVVVDKDARNTGIGEALSEHALLIARAEGARTINLTSRPSRKAANRLYQRIGFKHRETNTYRIKFES